MHMDMRWAALAGLLVATTAGCGALDPQQRAVAHFVQAQLLIEQNELDAALLELAEALKADPDLAIAHTIAGDVHRRRGDYERARLSYEVACRKNPYAVRAHYNLGVTYQMLAAATDVAERVERLFRLAVGVYLHVLELDADDFDTNVNLSACYYSLDELDLAEKYCLAAIGINRAQVAEAEKIDDPEARAARVGQLNRQGAPAHCNLGIICDAQGRTWDAIRAYKASLELDPTQPNLWLNLGMTRMRQGKLKDAIRNFRQAARYNGADIDLWEQMGICQYRLRQFSQALQTFQRAAKLAPDRASVHRALGVVYMSQFILDRNREDLRDRGLAAWRSSLEIDPDQDRLKKLLDRYLPRRVALSR